MFVDVTFVTELVKKIFFRLFCCHFFHCLFPQCLQSDNNSNRVYVLGYKYFWALLRAYFNPSLLARAKMSLSQAQNIFMPVSINSIILLNKGMPVNKQQNNIIHMSHLVDVMFILLKGGSCGYNFQVFSISVLVSLRLMKTEDFLRLNIRFLLNFSRKTLNFKI